jgi:hypothetical protein
MQYGPFFKIIPLTDPILELPQMLENDSGKLEFPARRLAQILINANCRTVIEESEYIDADFRDAHHRFYYLHYKDTSRRCKRLHFFASEVTAGDLWSMTPAIAGSYLGSIVIRPIPVHKLGTTFLASDLIRHTYPELYPNEERHMLCEANHTVHIAGNALSHFASPWMEQDSLVAMCASASIWIANRCMCERFPKDFQSVPSATITEQAAHFNLATGRSMPSSGLTTEQMLLALRSIGYEPLYIEPRSRAETYSIATHYIRSRIPVILILWFPGQGGHATTLIGHTLATKPYLDKHTAKSRFVDMSNYVPRFIMQDDSGGPNRFVEFLGWDEGIQKGLIDKGSRIHGEGDQVVLIDGGSGKSQSVAVLQSLIIPLPRRVTLTANFAFLNAVRLVRRLWRQSPVISHLIMDTYLRPSNEYKEWWSASQARPQDLAPDVRRHQLPNWIWVTDLGTKKDGENTWSILGQIVQDSSGRGTEKFIDDSIVLLFPHMFALGMPDGTINSSRRENDAEPIATSIPFGGSF